jgi:hypothetical protein
MGETRGPFPWVLWAIRLGALVVFVAAVVALTCGVMWAFSR